MRAAVQRLRRGPELSLKEWAGSLEPMRKSPMQFLVMDDPTSTWGHGVESFDKFEGAFTHGFLGNSRGSGRQQALPTMGV